MEIKELKSKKEILRQEIQKLIDSFVEDTNVSIGEIEYDVLANVGNKSTLTIRNIKLNL